MPTKKNRPPIKVSHRFVELMPPRGMLEEGILYISIDYRSIRHKCACGCGNEVSTPLSPKDWQISYNGETVSLHPSVGSWSLPCRSHYIIRNNMVLWAEDWSDVKVKRARVLESQNRDTKTSLFDRFF
jgi:hypothetical protein